MSAAKSIRSANVTPRSTPPGLQSSDTAVRTILAKRAARIDELEIENAALQHQLQDALSRNGHDARARIAIEAETAAELARMSRTFRELKARHEKLKADYDKCHKYVKSARKKYEAAKTNAKQWQAYLTKLNTREVKHVYENPPGANAPLPSQPPAVPREPSDYNVTPTPLPRASPKIADAAKEAHAVNEPAANSARQTEAPTTNSEHTRMPESSSHSNRISSSQTTEDDQAEVRSSLIKLEAGSDEEPVIVREKVLRRGRKGSASAMPPPRRIKQEPESPQRPGSAEEPIELRSEQWSSPATRAHPLVRMETSDLDAMRGTYQTPRKRRWRDESRARSEERSDATLHPPKALARNSSSLSDRDIPDLPPSPVDFEAVEDHNHQSTPSKQKITPKERSHGRQRGALGNLSPNVPTGQQTAKKRRRISEEDAGKVSMLAEDGDENTSQITPKADTTALAKTPASHRLDAMLENPTPARQPLSTRRPAPDTTKRIRPQNPQNQPEPISHTKIPAPISRHYRPPGLEKSPPPINPDSEPLRSRPMQQLRPHNFRINPAFADSDHAFVDPMNRKTKAARRCLPGCINPACCGEFLDAARHGLLPPSSKSDVQVIEDMFGSSHAEILARYPASKHAEILIQARAQEFANEHGRHRKTFERAATPPGFWRTEMPSTQEELEDRRQAEEMERMKVEGMWREAMRGGGRWLFRDE